MYFFEDNFDDDTIRRHFEFYEPLTVHESSLSPCIHSILASSLNMKAKAYEMYLRTSRLDIDDYNNDTEDGLHITSMGGTWMSIVKGFAGARVNEGRFNFKPLIPDSWNQLEFNTRINGSFVNIQITKDRITFNNLTDSSCTIYVHDNEYHLDSSGTIAIDL